MIFVFPNIAHVVEELAACRPSVVLLFYGLSLAYEQISSYPSYISCVTPLDFGTSVGTKRHFHRITRSK
jgi:hypothetical protein